MVGCFAAHLACLFFSSSGTVWAARSPILGMFLPAKVSGSPVGSLPLGLPSRLAVSTRLAFCRRSLLLSHCAQRLNLASAFQRTLALLVSTRIVTSCIVD